jgi:uncharacterized membrane protein YfcA
MEYSIILYILIFAVALLYSSVGHGGASGYLALMGLLGISQTVSKPVALVLNCIVSLIAFIQFYRQGYFNLKLFGWLIVASTPMAFIGGLIQLDAIFYKQILGFLLLITSLRLFIDFKNTDVNNSYSIPWLLVIGGSIGFISGLIGIGGGILLSPLLILLGWANIKTTAGISALFIFVNSIAGLAAQFSKGITISNSMIGMILIASLGGFIGSYLGARYANNRLIKSMLSIALMIAAFKLILL